VADDGLSDLPTQSATAERCGVIAQLGERFNGIEEVVGSIPSGSTKQKPIVVSSLVLSSPISHSRRLVARVTQRVTAADCGFACVTCLYARYSNCRARVVLGRVDLKLTGKRLL